MYKYLVAVSVIFFSTISIADEWFSPIDKKYLAKDSELFAKLDQSRKILDTWRGQKEKLKKADSLLREIIEKDAEYAPAYREYGRLYVMAGYVKSDNFNKLGLSLSESSILKSLEIEPEYADSYVLLGHTYTKMKRYKEAENALRKAEEIGTKIPWLQLNWADLLKKQKKYSEAMQLYKDVVKNGSENKKAYGAALSGVTTMYKYMKDYDGANEGYRNEINYRPNDAWTWGNYSSFLLFKYKDVDGAIEKGRKAIQLMNYGMGRFTLSCALYTKWAMLMESPATSLQAQAYFDQAWSIYPYPEKVIEKTKKYSYTKVTAIALEKWLTSKDSTRRGAGNWARPSAVVN